MSPNNKYLVYFFICLFCFAFVRTSLSDAKENVSMTIKIIDYVYSRSRAEGYGFHAVYDASKCLILSPEKYKGLELFVYHQVTPNKEGGQSRQQEQNEWKTKGKFINFTISNETLERSFERSKWLGETNVYSTDIVVVSVKQN